MRGLFLKRMPRKIVFQSLVSILAIFLIFFPLNFLILSLESGKIISCWRVTPKELFTLAYIHSVAKSEVREIFQVGSAGQIILVETHFQGQGTGLPYNLSGSEKLYRKGDWFYLQNMQRVIPAILWRVQSAYQNRFFFRGQEINFSLKINNGLIRIEIKKMSPFKWAMAYLQNLLK